MEFTPEPGNSVFEEEDVDYWFANIVQKGDEIPVLDFNCDPATLEGLLRGALRRAERLNPVGLRDDEDEDDDE